MKKLQNPVSRFQNAESRHSVCQEGAERRPKLLLFYILLPKTRVFADHTLSVERLRNALVTGRAKYFGAVAVRSQAFSRECGF